MGVDVVLGIEARGFIFAPALAYALGAGFVPVRKPKKLPAECARVTYDLEYGTDTLEIHRDAIPTGCRVLIVDDLLATGGTAKATTRLVEDLGGTVAGRGICGGADLSRRARKAQRLQRFFPAPVRQMKTAQIRADGARAGVRQAEPRAARSLPAPRRIPRDSAPSFRPFLWPIVSIFRSRRREPPESRSKEHRRFPTIWSNERLALYWKPLRFMAMYAVSTEEEHSRRGRVWAVDRPTPRPSCSRCPCWREKPCRPIACTRSRRNSAATCRSFCTAERRSVWAAARNSIPCPTCPPRAVCWWCRTSILPPRKPIGICLRRLTSIPLQNKLNSFQQEVWRGGRGR